MDSEGPWSAAWLPAVFSAGAHSSLSGCRGLLRPADTGRRDLGLPSPAARYQVCRERLAAGAATSSLARQPAREPKVTVAAEGLSRLGWLRWCYRPGSALSPHDFVGLLGLIGTQGHHLCLAC